MTRTATEPSPAVVNKFSFARAADAAFEPGLRGFFEYRDLGIGAATGGRYHAHVIRATEATEGATGKHRHGLDFQMVYILKGRASFWYEGEGTIELGPGDCVYQPPGIVHELVSCSDDLEMLEITSPEDFSTEDAT